LFLLSNPNKALYSLLGSLVRIKLIAAEMSYVSYC